MLVLSLLIRSVGCRHAAIWSLSEEERTFLVRIQTDEDDPKETFPHLRS
jgi:hypothetical protein